MGFCGFGWCKPNVQFSLLCFTFALHFGVFLRGGFCDWFTLLYFGFTWVVFCGGFMSIVEAVGCDIVLFFNGVCFLWVMM